MLLTVENEGVRQDTEQRIDLIKFYNTIFVQIVRDNALRYSTNSSVSCQDFYIDTSFLYKVTTFYNYFND